MLWEVRGWEGVVGRAGVVRTEGMGGAGVVGTERMGGAGVVRSERMGGCCWQGRCCEN